MYDDKTKNEAIGKRIVELFLARSETAISIAKERFERLAYSVSFNILHNNEDAEECVNDAFLALWNSIPPNEPRSFSAYLCSLVRNISLNRYDYNHAAKRGGETDVIFDELSGVISDGDYKEALREGEITDIINLFLAEQKEKDRIIFVRRYFYSDSIEDICSYYGDSEGSVAMRLSRLRAKLRKKLEKEGISI